MIRTGLTLALYAASGALVTALWAILLMTMWGHRHNMKLSEVFKIAGTKDKMTLEDWCYLALALAFWPIVTVAILWAVAKHPEELMDQIDEDLNKTTN